jgi:hypothetical protein
MSIATPDALRDHLRIAMRLELSTVPLYLYALYSIEDPACEAAQLIRSIVAEEMLHFALVANLMLAVGGEPGLDDPTLRPAYPSFLANHVPPLVLNLAPATPEQIRTTFLVIEQPDPPGSPTEPGVYDSLGEFYAAIGVAIERFGADPAFGLFARPQTERQLSDPRFYGAVAFNAESTGDLMLVDGIAAARAAIEVIVHQGEGLSDDLWVDAEHQELTHFAKFRRIADGTSPIGGLRPLPVNPRGADYPPDAQRLSDLFNAVYAAMFLLLAALYEPRPRKGGLVGRLYLAMTGVLAPIGRALATIPVGGGLTAGPTFEPFDLGTDPAETLATLAHAAAAEHPELAAAVEPLIARRLLPTTPDPGAGTSAAGTEPRANEDGR